MASNKSKRSSFDHSDSKTSISSGGSEKKVDTFSFIQPYLDEIDNANADGDANLYCDYACPSIKPVDGENNDDNDDGTSNYRAAPDFEYITNYDEYLDHYVTPKDLHYFESDDISRVITTLGFRVPELLSRHQFNKVMEEIRARRFEKRRDDIHISWEISPELITCPLMQALGEREVANRNGNLACIVYVRTTNLRNEEVSAWIDYRVRLKSDDQLWYDYFAGTRKLIPRPSDLCYYNWATFQVRFNSSENYLITTDINEGLQFMNKADRKLITVDPKGSPGDNTDVIHIRSKNYNHSVIYDHFLRIKA